jgi:hypothetical protein
MNPNAPERHSPDRKTHRIASPRAALRYALPELITPRVISDGMLTVPESEARIKQRFSPKNLRREVS